MEQSLNLENVDILTTMVDLSGQLSNLLELLAKLIS
jgi:hypothetical protein